MRLGIDIREFRKSSITGISRYLLNFINVAAQKRRDYKLFVYGNQLTNIAKLPKRCHITIMPEKLTVWWDQIILPQQIKKDAIDIFLSPYYKAPILSACPTIITIHDVLFLYISSKKVPWKWIYNTLFSVIARIMASKAKAVITDSQNSKSEIVTYLKIPEEKIKVIYLGSSSQFKPLKEKEHIEQIKKKYGIQGEYILYVGNFKPHKNVTRLIKAYHMLAENLKKKYCLVLTGVKDYGLVRLLKLASDLKIEDKLLYIGEATDEHLPALYSGAKVFVIPSLAEGFGLPALEAMSCGTPVISGNRGALPEVVGDAAILVNPLNVNEIYHAIHNLLNDPNLYKSLQIKGFLRAKEFNSTQSAEKIMDIIDEIYHNPKLIKQE